MENGTRTREDEPDLAPRLGCEWNELDWQTLHPLPVEERPPLPPLLFNRLKQHLGRLGLRSSR